MSEFGSGAIVCLAKFSEHIHPSEFARWQERDVLLGDTKEQHFSKSLEMLMNAASDHFYDLDRERAPKPLNELADLTLGIGHGFSGKIWTEDDWKTIRRLWQESCEALDRQLGVEPDWGEW